MTRQGVLKSTFHAARGDGLGRFDVHVRLLDGRFEPGDLLGMCSGAVLRPGATSGATTHETLSTRLVLRPNRPELITRTSQWIIPDLEAAHPVVHANHGPVSAWIERLDGTALELEVVPAELDGRPPEHARNGSGLEPSDDPIVDLLPRPTAMMSEGSPRRGIAIAGLHDSTGRWPAVEALARRLGMNVESGGQVLALDASIDPSIHDGSYELQIDAADARLRGSSAKAVTHGFITLAQLVAAGVPERVVIKDAPRHRHRGLSIDLARRWFEPSVVERLIDVAAWRKLSHLQLHLTDDEAWRIPVDAYPALTEVGGTRGHRLAIGPLCGSGAAPYGRAYTSAEIGRWVERAAALGIELVPEVDVPGHCHAAIVALPELHDAADRSHAVSVQGFRDNVLVPGPETTRFLHEVFGSLADLFPNSSVLHLGGDEVPLAAWTKSPRAAEYGQVHGTEPGPALAAALIADAAAAIEGAGRAWAGWQEVARFDHAIEPAYVVAWKSSTAIHEVLDGGHRVVASPSDAYYLDMAVDDGWSTPGASWAGSTPMTKTGDLDLTAFESAHGELLGGQAAMWCEHISSLEVLDELLFPRLDAVAEATWTGDTTGKADEIGRRSSGHPTVLRQASSVEEPSHD